MTWVVRLPTEGLRWVLRWRLHAGIEMVEVAGELWVRGDASSAPAAIELGTLPGAERFSMAADGSLLPAGSLLATAKAPGTGWKLLLAWCPELPSSAYPGAAPEILLRLAPTSCERPTDVLRCAWTAWANWCETAPAHRLACLRFAAMPGGHALVIGKPLPPVPGQHFARVGVLAVPAGWQVAPALDDDDLQRVLMAEAGDLIIADAGSVWELVPSATLVTASRSAVRMTAEVLRA